MLTALPRTVRLPRHIEPAGDEALASWIAQISAMLGQSPLMLGRSAFGVDASVDPQWWRRPSDATLSRIGDRTGLEPARLRTMTFLGYAAARSDEDADRFASRRWISPVPSQRRGRRIDICPQCIAEDGRPYLRLLWMMGWAGVCPRHRTVLTGQCPSCRGAIRLESLSARSPVDLLSCRKCGVRLAGPESEAARPLAIDLQDILVAGKRNGTVNLPGVGQIDWSVMMALADMLLGMIWTDIATGHRKCRFDRIARDIALGGTDRMTPPWTSNYGGLLMLGWMLEDVQSRLPAAIAILHAPHFDRLLARLSDVADATGERLRTILAPAIVKPPVGRRSWRAWVDNLPESASNLRDRAARVRYKHRRQSLTAFSELKGGTSVDVVAASVGVMPRTVYRWLHRGADRGLEAALERPTGRTTLTAAQAETLAQWIAADRLHQNRRVIAEHAGTLFGVALNPDAASKLLAKHRRAKPGQRRRLWRPRPRHRVDAAGSSHDPAPGP